MDNELTLEFDVIPLLFSSVVSFLLIKLFFYFYFSFNSTNSELISNPNNSNNVEKSKTAIQTNPSLEEATPNLNQIDKSNLLKSNSNRVGIRLIDQKLQPNGKKGETTLRTSGEISNNQEYGYEIAYNKPSSKIQLEWVDKPKTILIVIRINEDKEILNSVLELINWLIKTYGVNLLIEEEETNAQNEKYLQFREDFWKALGPLAEKFTVEKLPFIDLTITLGGDSTLLYVSHLFQQSVPPIVSYYLGDFKEDLTNIFDGKCFVLLRLRLNCVLLTKDPSKSVTRHVLNEVVVNREPSSHLTSFDCYCDKKLITTANADGIIIASSTGSTAYSMSCGAALVHPLFPGIILTPISPFSLSFRPVVLPASSEIKIQIPEDSFNVHVSFDGRYHQKLLPGEALQVTISQWPFTSVYKTEQTASWFQTLADHLNWNRRVKQKQKKI